MSIKGFNPFAKSKKQELSSDDFKFLIKGSGRTVQRSEMDCDLRITSNSIIIKSLSLANWFSYEAQISATIMMVKNKMCLAVANGSYDNFIKLQRNKKGTRFYVPVPKAYKQTLPALQGKYSIVHIQRLESIEIFELIKQ